MLDLCGEVTNNIGRVPSPQRDAISIFHCLSKAVTDALVGFKKPAILDPGSVSKA
jgi:hypothetical protein